MSDPFIRIAATREQAHEAITAAYGIAKVMLLDGKRVKVSISQDQDDKSARQRRFLHGVVLKQIAEQVVVDGRRYVLAIWKEHFRALFLGSTWETYRLPGEPEARPHEHRISSEDLLVGPYSKYIDQVIAHAITELDVAFDFNEWEREAVRHHEPKTTKEKAPC